MHKYSCDFAATEQNVTHLQQITYVTGIKSSNKNYFCFSMYTQRVKGILRILNVQSKQSHLATQDAKSMQSKWGNCKWLRRVKLPNEILMNVSFLCQKSLSEMLHTLNLFSVYVYTFVFCTHSFFIGELKISIYLFQIRPTN